MPCHIAFRLLAPILVVTMSLSGAGVRQAPIATQQQCHFEKRIEASNTAS
jgi:hypothetical protein